MKNLIKIIISLFLFILIGCSKDSSNSNPLGANPIGGGNENVTFQVSIQQDQQGLFYFIFKPSVSVKIIKVEATLNNQPQGTVNGDATTVYSTADGFSLQVNNPITGDNWIFKVTGRTADANKDFTTTVNYTVQQGNGGNGTVTFEISSQTGQQGGVDFLFKPSVDIKITKVDVAMGGATDVVNGDGTTVYSSTNWYVLAGYNNVASGQQWSFTFTGTIAANNQNYNVTVNYSVP